MKIVAFAMVAAVSCGTLTPTPKPDNDGPCAALCSRISELQCPGWDGSHGPDEEPGTGDDVSCQDACVDLQENGADLKASCVADAGSCEEVDGCFDAE